jgi:hypothetical protein
MAIARRRRQWQKGRPRAAFRICDPALSYRGESALASAIGHDANPRQPLTGSGAPECDGACDGSGPGPYGVAVVAALNDPLTVFLADNFPDVMAPHHDGADLGTARV